MHKRNRWMMALVPMAVGLSMAAPTLADEHDGKMHRGNRMHTERTYRLYEMRPVSPELQQLQNFYSQSVAREEMISQQRNQFHRANALPLSETWGRMSVDQMILSSRARQILRANDALPPQAPMVVMAPAGTNVTVMFDALGTPLPQQTTHWSGLAGTAADPHIRDLYTQTARTYETHNTWIGNTRAFVTTHPMYGEMVAGLRQEIQPLGATNQDLLRRFFEANFKEAHHMSAMANMLQDRGDSRLAEVFHQIAADHSRSASMTQNLLTQTGVSVPQLSVDPMPMPQSRAGAIRHALDMHRAQLPMVRQWAAQADNPTAKNLLQQGVMVVENHIRMLEDLRR